MYTAAGCLATLSNSSVFATLPRVRSGIHSNARILETRYLSETGEPDQNPSCRDMASSDSITRLRMSATYLTDCFCAGIRSSDLAAGLNGGGRLRKAWPHQAFARKKIGEVPGMKVQRFRGRKTRDVRNCSREEFSGSG